MGFAEVAGEVVAEMKKTISLFKRDYEGTRLVYDEVVPGAEWVIRGEGVATNMFGEKFYKVREGVLYKPAPEYLAEAEANCHAWYWPGWVPVGDGPEDQEYQEDFGNGAREDMLDGTYDIVEYGIPLEPEPPRDLAGLREWFSEEFVEGIVWHHPDGRMVKIKRKDFGFSWPPEGEKAVALT